MDDLRSFKYTTILRIKTPPKFHNQKETNIPCVIDGFQKRKDCLARPTGVNIEIVANVLIGALLSL